MSRQTVGDVRGDSLGDYWPYSAVCVGADFKWVLCDLTKPLQPQIEKARETYEVFLNPHVCYMRGFDLGYYPTLEGFPK